MINYTEFRICETCNKEFNCYKHSTRKFCSRQCSSNSLRVRKIISEKATIRKRDKLSEVTRNKIRLGNTGKNNKSRGPNISKSRIKYLLNNWPEVSKQKIRFIVEKMPWVWSYQMFKYHLGENYVNFPGLMTVANQYGFRKKSYEEGRKNLPLHIQKWSYNKMHEFIKEYNSKVFIIEELQQKYQTKKSIYSLINFLVSQGYVEPLEKLKNSPYAKIRVHKKRNKETLPEKIFKDKILKKNNISFEQEKYINNMKWRVDFIVNNLYIEIQGDYWHANPLFYEDRSKLTKKQLYNITRDFEKKNWIISHGFKYTEIWENDLLNNLNETEHKFLEIYGSITEEN